MVVPTFDSRRWSEYVSALVSQPVFRGTVVSFAIGTLEGDDKYIIESTEYP